MRDSIGKQLRNQREQKNIQLQEVTDELHIRIEYLQALENDERQKLPSNVQAKGFLRLYAAFLDLKPEKLISQWDGIQEPDVESETSPDPSITSNTEESNDDEKAEQSSLTTPIEETDTEDDKPTIDETPSSHQLLKELGLLFMQQRKILQLSYADVEQATHIRKTILESIEENRFNELPSSVQAKGMLESYAAFMNMDVDHTLELYAEALQQKRIETQQIAEISTKNRKNEKSSKTQLPIRKLFTPDLIIGSSLIIVVLVIAILSIAKVVNTNQKRLELNSFLTQTNIIEISPTSTPTFTPPPEPTESDSVEELVPSNQATQNIDSPEEITSVNLNAMIQLHLTTNQRAWLQVIADEEVKFNGRVLPGSAYQFYADEKLEFATGNAAAFSAILIQNGEQTDLGILGIVGQVINITILPESIITPTAVSTATPTITNTPPATQTQTPASDSTTS
ncbi:MAG: helix-turn-helix domain-containing protein [Anaerolineaceae bacterium]|nr:helix-turn-helix domain-containing protein [Anaerolineaceae bacterium]